MTDLRRALADAASLTHPDRTQTEREALRGALRTLQDALEERLPEHKTKSGEGMGNQALIPWVSVHRMTAQALRPDPKSGFYLVYLIAHDGSTVSLALVVGVYSLGSKFAIQARAEALRAAQPVPEGVSDKPAIEPLGVAESYIEGSAYSINYELENLPTNESLEDDLKAMIGRLDAIWDSGLTFNAGGEPLHIFFPWVEDSAGDGIVKARKAIADEVGSAWWTTGRTISDAKLADLTAQIASGIPTFVYLYAAGDSWRTRLMEVTDEAERVRQNPKLLADGHDPEDDRLAMRLANFEALPGPWRGEGLFVSTTGRPVHESVERRPAFSFVYSGRPEDHMGIDASPEPITLASDSSSIASELQELAGRSGLPVEFLRDMYEVLTSDMPQLVLSGPPGTGKTWLAKELAVIGNTRAEPHSIVQFHPSYAYEDFVEGLRPEVENGQVVFRTVPGHLLQLVRELPDGGPNTLIIDELNRANIPSVFGELLYLLEYRHETIRLRMSGRFSLPADMRFVATMNAADRSVRSIDAALRRRFEIFELAPSGAALSNYYETHTLDVPDLIDGFMALNDRLSEAIDRHHGIGHSFFMADHMTSAKLRAAWERKVRPIIEEYFFDEPQRVETDFEFHDLWPSQIS